MDVKVEANIDATGKTKLDAKNGYNGSRCKSRYKTRCKTQCINLTQKWMQKEMQYLMQIFDANI
jgi:hypothetical protein